MTLLGEKAAEQRGGDWWIHPKKADTESKSENESHRLEDNYVAPSPTTPEICLASLVGLVVGTAGPAPAQIE